MRAGVSQLRNAESDNSFDQTPLIYSIGKRNLKRGRRRVQKTFLFNNCNRDELGETYREEIPKLVQETKNPDTRTAQDVSKKVTKVLTGP